MAEEKPDKIRFMIDRDKNEITFYLDEKMLRSLAKRAVEKNISSDVIAGNITIVCHDIAEYLCKKLKIDMDKLKPHIVIEKMID